MSKLDVNIYLLLSQTLTPLLLEIVKLTTHNNLSFALKEGNFFPKKVFTSASHAESSFVGASDVSHSICCNYCYYSGVPDQRPDTRCVTKDI